MYLDADEVLVAEDVERAARAHRPDLARGVLPRRDQLHRRARRRHGGHPQRAARVPQPPEYRFEGRLHEQIAQNLPAYAPSGSSRRRCGSSTTATSAPCATPRRSRGATSSCCRPRRPRAPPTPFLHFNLGSEYAAPANARGAGRVRARLGDDREPGPRGPTSSRRRCSRGWSRRCATAAAPRRRSPAPTRACAFPRLHRPRLRAGARLARARPRGRRHRLLRAVHRDGRRAARYTATVGCGTYLPAHRAGRAAAARGELERRARAARLVHRPSTPASSALIAPYATALLRGGTPAEDSRRPRSRRAWPTLTPDRALHARHGAVRARRAAAAERQYRPVLERQPAQRAGARRARRGAALPAPLRRGGGRGGARSPPTTRSPRSPAAPSCRAVAPATSSGATRRSRAPRTPACRPAELALFAGWAEVAGGTPARPAACRSRPRRCSADARGAAARAGVRDLRAAAPAARALASCPTASGASCSARCICARVPPVGRAASGWPCASAAPTRARWSAWRASRGARAARGRRGVRRRGAQARPLQRRRDRDPRRRSAAQNPQLVGAQ